MEITTEQFNSLLTKKDAEKFITKEDAKKFATKDDLKKFATKDEFDGLEKKFDKLLTQVIANTGDIKELKERFDGVDIKLDAIMTTLDGVARIVGVNETERASNIAAHDRFETRITRVESELKLEPIFS